jgi:chaperonin GroEL (HSP60 family)
MAKQVLFRSTAREKILHGATQLADAVRVTLGPRSKSVLIEKKWGTPIVCNDGVTIAKALELKDREENLGVQMLRQAAEKTGEVVGDGTSTATLLAHAILADGVRNVVAGASAIDLKRGLDRAASVAIAELRRMSRPVQTRKEKAQVAAISAHNDPATGELVAEAIEKVGNDGVITVEESKTTETALEVVEGMQFDRGFISHYFVTNPDKMEAVLEDAFVLLSDRKIGSLQEFLPVLDSVAKSGRALLVVAEDVEGEALDDAISATKAAVAEGVVPGGGLALLRCIPAVEQEEAKSEGDERTGVQILKRALEVPTRQIAENSAVDGGVVVARMMASETTIGFDAARKQYVDLMDAGIIDPTKVVRTALENAVSVASVLLLTEATMTEIPELKREHMSEPEAAM